MGKYTYSVAELVEEGLITKDDFGTTNIMLFDNTEVTPDMILTSFLEKYINREINQDLSWVWLKLFRNRCKIELGAMYKRLDGLKGDFNDLFVDYQTDTTSNGENIGRVWNQGNVEEPQIETPSYMTGANKSNSDNTSSTKTSSKNQLERSEIYVREYKRIYNEFLNSFENLFLTIY